METLKFKLISNNKTEIEGTSNYYIKDNVINFKLDDVIYSFNMDNNIFIKRDNDTSITIDISNKLVVINLLSIGNSFDMPIIKSNIEKNDNSIKLEYSFESDEIINNIIYIEY